MAPRECSFLRSLSFVIRRRSWTLERKDAALSKIQCRGRSTPPDVMSLPLLLASATLSLQPGYLFQELVR